MPNYVWLEQGTRVWVAFCISNGPCDHDHEDSIEAADCAKAADARTGHFHAIKPASRLSGIVYYRPPMYPAKTADHQVGRKGLHPATGRPC